MKDKLSSQFRSLAWFLAGISLASAFLSGCAHDYVTGRSSYNWFKLRDDVSLGNEVMGAQLQAFDHKKTAVDASQDQVMLDRLKTIVHNIAQVSHLPELPYE